ncbi:hypothetical protein G6F56_013816 [Rhizopus delemar]|nr:hypothetical protein G6F32_015244 [Rhizopus arrhizus]KAG1435829.1 hypothetical protein G6F56_013816 [Rhizopus delemar]
MPADSARSRPVHGCPAGAAPPPGHRVWRAPGWPGPAAGSHPCSGHRRTAPAWSRRTTTGSPGLRTRPCSRTGCHATAVRYRHGSAHAAATGARGSSSRRSRGGPMARTGTAARLRCWYRTSACPGS